jgi:hypothetical protein
MELIPILSTIILVATICTFILAIGAYILYKIRERRGEQAQYSPPSTVQAELVAPEEGMQPVEPYHMKSSEGRDTYQERRSSGSERAEYYPSGEDENARQNRIKKQKKTGKKFLKYTSEGYVPTEEDKNTGILKWR